MEILANPVSAIQTLICPSCSREYDIYSIQSFAQCCNQPLIATYNTHTLSFKDIDRPVKSMWRYKKLLPLFNEENIVSLGEGWTQIKV